MDRNVLFYVYVLSVYMTGIKPMNVNITWSWVEVMFR